MAIAVLIGGGVMAGWVESESEQMRLRVVQEPWYAEGLRFSCTQCGNCCTGGPGFVWISDEEVDRLAAHLGMTVEATMRKYCRRIGDRLSLKERLNRGYYDCIFLTEEAATSKVKGRTVRSTRRGCSIYPVRPLQCRTWPFWDGLLESPDAWAAAKGKCPGMDKGEQFTREEIEAKRDAEDWPEE